jgi:hypothetical protein
MMAKRNTKLVNILLLSRMLYALLILVSALLIVVLINGLYQHNHEILDLDFHHVYGALPQKPPFGEGMLKGTITAMQYYELSTPSSFSSYHPPKAIITETKIINEEMIKESISRPKPGEIKRMR